MEQQQHFSTSKVTVECFDPHGVYQLIALGLAPRLPLRNLHWQSHAGPLRSIDTLHVELIQGGVDPSDVKSPNASPLLRRSVSASAGSSSKADGFQTQIGGGKSASTEQIDVPVTRPSQRRHQIPGLRRTPYLKVLLVRCDDGEEYKSKTRSEIREWIKAHTPPSQSTRKVNTQENHDAYEWLIIHVVIPNTVAASQPRFSGKSSDTSTSDKSSSRWRSGSSTLLEKLRSDFNGTGKSGVDRVAQIRIGINDVPYDLLPRVVPTAPTGHTETAQDAENAWLDLITKFKSLILSSFDMRVSQYEDDIKEKDAQRALPGWNFCTFFMLKEGLARGFESVGLVEDALVGYDELSVGLDSVIQEQAIAGDPERHGGALLGHTEELKSAAERAKAAISSGQDDLLDDEETVDLQSQGHPPVDRFDDIPISSSKKPYRDMILANKVSIFDFKCYIFARQISLLLRLGNAWSTREELLIKVKEQQESVLHGVAPRAPSPKPTDESEILSMLAEICRRTLEFIPTISQVMRSDIIAALGESKEPSEEPRLTEQLDPILEEVADNMVASFAFSVAQQILAQTSTKALPIPPSTLGTLDGQEPKASIPEPKTMMHPARSTSLHVRPPRPPPSPNFFPGARPASFHEHDLASSNTQFLKAGLEDLAAHRAEVYTVSRNLLDGRGKRRGWNNGWAEVPTVGESELVVMEEISLDDDATPTPTPLLKPSTSSEMEPSLAAIGNRLLRTALESKDDFYRLYETLTDKALRHYTVANQTHAVHANLGDLAVLKYSLGQYGDAAAYFYKTVPFFGESGWSLLELSMLILYSRCLEKLQWKEDYVKRVLKMLTKASAAQRDILHQKSTLKVNGKENAEHFDTTALEGFVGDLLSVTKTLSNEWMVPLASFFTDVEIAGAPDYHDGRDSFSLTLKLCSLLVDEIEIDTVRLHLSPAASKSATDIWVECKASQVLKPGKNLIRLSSNSIIPGKYKADQLVLSTNNVILHFERDIAQEPGRTAEILRHPDVALHQRLEAFDIRLLATKQTHLDKNNSLELEICTGWNSVKSCEIRVRAATGGLRLATTEATLVDTSIEFAKPPGGGLFVFDAMPAEASTKLRFPFSVEQDVPIISLRLEASYKTDDGIFTFCDTPSISVSLALGVNVQDIFKHNALFSRFTVSTASSSPLRLFRSELIGSDVFESHFGIPPSSPVMIFPKQPASLLYKILRKTGVAKSNPQKTLHLTLYYSVLRDEIEEVVKESLFKMVEQRSVKVYWRLIQSIVLDQVRSGLSAYDLERAALLGEFPTSFLAEVNWESQFSGLGTDQRTGKDITSMIAAFLHDWRTANGKLVIPQSAISQGRRSIIIPVDVPSIPVLHTVDIRLQTPIPSPSPSTDSNTPVVRINQLLPATLHLKWTRAWDTTSNPATDLKYSYEFTAPTDTWLLGGRRRGHFVVSSVASEMHIPLLLAPLREGWLPYPSVEIREVQSTEEDDGVLPGGQCELDYRNLGETVRAVADRERVTLSLDASGPGGGPLVLESESKQDGRVIA